MRMRWEHEQFKSNIKNVSSAEEWWGHVPSTWSKYIFLMGDYLAVVYT